MILPREGALPMNATTPLYANWLSAYQKLMLERLGAARNFFAAEGCGDTNHRYLQKLIMSSSLLGARRLLSETVSELSE